MIYDHFCNVPGCVCEKHKLALKLRTLNERLRPNPFYCETCGAQTEYPSTHCERIEQTHRSRPIPASERIGR